jgi:hypothetical protein
MKQLFLTMLILGSIVFLGAAKWQTITNTSHVYDLMKQNSDIYFSTWGGVVKIVPQQAATYNIWDYEQSKVWTSADGLASNDVRNIEYISTSQSLWFGSAFNGVSIVNPQGIQQLNTTLGLPSNNVTGIVEHGSEILVATTNGLASYYYLEGVNFPLMLHQYTSQNTNGALLSNQIDALALSEENYLYLSSTAGINFVHLDSLDVDSAWHHFTASPVPGGFENKLYLNYGKLLVATPASVYVHSSDPWTEGWQSYGTNEGLLAESISSACIDHWSNIWVSYGLWDEDFLSYSRASDTLMTVIYSDASVKHWNAFESGLGDKCITRVLEYGNDIYLCSWGDGIFQQMPNPFKEDATPTVLDAWTNFQSNSIGFPKVRNIATDANHVAWFSSGALNQLPRSQPLSRRSLAHLYHRQQPHPHRQYLYRGSGQP